MSNNTSDIPGYNTVISINFTGGFPTHRDFAPSILFVVLYTLSIPVLLWRLISKKHRTRLLIRPTIFLAARIAMLIIRAVMAETTYGISLLIAELTLAGIGYLFLIEPVIFLWRRSVDLSLTIPEPRWVRLLATLCWLTLLAAIITIIVAGAITSNAFTDANALNNVINLRHASYVLSLSVVVLIALALALTHFRFHLANLRSAYMLIPIISLLIVAVYRVVQTYTFNPSAPVRGLAAFWILQIFFEFVTYVSYLAISIPEWFPTPPKHNGRASNPEMAETGGRPRRFSVFRRLRSSVGGRDETR